MADRFSLRTYALFILALLAAMLLCVCVGSVSVAPKDTLTAIFCALLGKPAPAGVAKNIIVNVRLPRVMNVALVGASLSLCGAAMQGLLRNPLADGSTLGVSSGAKLAVGAVMIFGMKLWGCVPFGAVMTAAFVGAMLCASFVMIVSRKIHSMAMLLVVGMMIGNVCSAATDFFVTFAKESDIANLTSWSMGSFSAVSWGNLRICLAVIAVCLLLCLLLAKPIGAYQFGEHYAASMGVNVRRFRAALIGLSCLLAACVTALVGPISFVGIAVPYMTKKLLGTAKPMAVLPGCFLLGGVFCMACDWIARTAFSPTELAISTVTAFFGAPVVIVMALKRGGGHR